MSPSAISPETFSTLGDLVKYLRKREELTQRELALLVGYSDSEISRIEKNHGIPAAATLTALFVPALHLEQEPQWVERLLELARQARLRELPETVTTATPNNLPASLTTFIGREKEQAEIHHLMRTQRLVTLTGSGGVGKTRISLQVGGQVLGEYANGVWLAELAPLSDPELVPQTVASLFGIVSQSARSHTELLINFLRPKTALLILDNCEHLLDAGAHLSDTLLRHCPHLKILATSREALGILGEVVYHMPSLGLPDIEQTLEKFREYESVRLFEERAQLAQPDFKLTLENASFVAQICSRLDGIPLAIELAAARVNIFSVAQIAARLDDRFHLLTSGSRTALPRQQTLRASIDWSWNLLSERERTLLQRLTLFAGGWILEAAESVCSAEGDIESPQVFELMTQLVAKSLVITNRQPGRERRFHLHETIRQYAHEKFIEAGEHENIHSQLLKYFLDLSGRAESALHGPHQMEWYNCLTDERDNLRVALEHASRPDASTADLEAGLSISARLMDYWIVCDLREGLRWSTELIQNPGSQTFPQARARTLITQGYILWSMQQFEAVRSIAEECLPVFRSYGDQQGEYDALILMGNMRQFAAGIEQRAEFSRQALVLARSMGDVLRQAFALYMLGWDQRDPQRAREHLEEAVALFRHAGDWRFLAQALGILGLTVLSNGDLESAQKILDEAYEVNQQSNNRAMEFVLTGKAISCMLRGEYGQARALLQKNIDDLERMGNRMGVLWVRARLAQVALHEGNVAEAHQILVDTIENFHTDGNKNGLVFALDKMSSLYVVTNKHEVSARLIGWSDATRKEIGDPRPPIEQADLDQDIAAIKAKLGVDAYETAYNSGWSLTLNEAMVFALAGKS
ncbi:MAG TPA: helix-turn-helix domain-containing protein [Anaerolineales bacterium]|nr:helix-turn-helix domain-containing protein [Anaerolineales bacterium]